MIIGGQFIFPKDILIKKGILKVMILKENGIEGVSTVETELNKA